MKKVNYSISKKTMTVVTLKQAEMLKKYGIEKPSEFEIAQLNKFGLTEHLDGIIVTETGIVLCNWEAVMIAKTTGIEEIEVVSIDNLTEEEIPQVIAIKNIRKKLSKKKLGELIIEYREYLTNTDLGKSWSKEIPGNSTDEKIGELLGYSYGMINGYQAIYNSHPEYLEMMDAGTLNFTRAMELLKQEKTKNNPVEPKIGEPDVTEIVPKKNKGATPKYDYAGERNMVPCDPVSSIQIVYANGKKLELIIDRNIAIVECLNKDLKASYKGVKENFEGGSEFHKLLFSDQKQFIELVIKMVA